MSDIKRLRKNLEKSFPALVARHGIRQYGWPYSEGYMRNLDSTGRGPTGAVRCGNRVCYPKESLIAWLISRMKGVGR